jgi:hypothetical protein
MNAPAQTNPFEGRLNPFEDTIVSEPRKAPPSVAGLNEAALDALERTFAQLEAAHGARAPVRSPKAQLVVSPDRGYGKTHLLGRLFAKLQGRAATIYLTPFQDPQKPWHSILRMTIDELTRPVGQETCQLQSLAIGVLARLGADLLTTEDYADYADAAKAVEFLRRLAGDPSVNASNKGDWIAWLTHSETLSSLLGRLRQFSLALDGRERAWLQVLAAAAREARYAETWSAAVKWMRAEALEPHEVERLSLDGADNDARGDSSPQEVNDLCYRRMRGFCAIALLHRPFVLCFDQTEFFVGDKALIHTFGKCVWQLVNSLPNHLTIVTANQSNWKDDLSPHIEPAHRARFSNNLVNLEGVDKKIAMELLRARLAGGGLDEQAIRAFLAANWVDQQFAAVAETGVRDLLTRADQRFRELAKQPALSPATLATLFDDQLAKIRANPALQRFDPDALMWFVKDLGAALDGVTVERTTGMKYFSLQWRWPGRRTCFAFEGGDHHRRWEGIAKEASALAKGAKGALATLVLRTPDLPGIPRPTWKATTAAIEAAHADGFAIVNLPADRLCEALAARELHANALQGNIDFDAERTLQWLRQRFVVFLNELAAGGQKSNDGTAGAGAGEPPVDATEALEPDHERTALAIVREQKIVDISVVLARIGGEMRRSALLRFCERHPNLKARSAGQSTVLQWRLSH